MFFYSGSGQTARVFRTFDTAVAVQLDDDGTANPGPVLGAEVTFTITSGSANFGGTKQSVTASSDKNGIARYTLVAGASPGPVTITATSAAAPSSSVTFMLIVSPAQVNPILAITGGGQSASFRDQFPRPIEAGLSDEYGRAVIGVTVTFAIESVGGTAAFADGAQSAAARTDERGVATAPPLTAGTKPGAVLVLARYPESARPAFRCRSPTHRRPAWPRSVVRVKPRPRTPPLPIR